MLHRVQVSNRHISKSTVQRRLCELVLHARKSAKKPLLKDTNEKNKLAWAKKHEPWTLDWWKSVLWSDLRFLVPVGERMISACVVPTVKQGGGGVMALRW